jgi:LysR family transcriptional regulator, glycine cleavage system transcriptional activator
MNDWLPSLNALRAFETVSRHLNYRKAAEELHVTPAAVKQLVAKLEDSLGIPLLEKRGRGIVLTGAGSVASGDLSKAFTQIAQSVEKLRIRSARKSLIISVDPSFAASWLIPRLDDFRSLNPDIDVLLDSSVRIVDLEHGTTDIAIRFAVPVDEELFTYRLFDEKLAALCSPSLARGPPKLTRIEDLEQVRLLRWDLSEFDWAGDTQKWNQWEHWLEQVGASHVNPGEGLRINDYNLALQAAIAGQGMIIGSLPVLASFLESNLLCSPFPEIAETNVGYDLVTTKSARSRPDVKRFVDWIINKTETLDPQN